jgi:hypothetical protein
MKNAIQVRSKECKQGFGRRMRYSDYGIAGKDETSEYTKRGVR